MHKKEEPQFSSKKKDQYTLVLSFESEKKKLKNLVFSMKMQLKSLLMTND